MDRLPKTVLRLSPTLQYVSLLLVMLGLYGLFSSGLPVVWKIAVLLVFLLVVWMDRPLSRFNAISALSWEGEDKGWSIWMDGERFAVRLRGATVMTRWWLSLNFIDENKRRYPLVLLPDSVGVENLRLLRVILRHAKT